MKSQEMIRNDEDFHQKCGLLRELTKIMIFHEFVSKMQGYPLGILIQSPSKTWFASRIRRNDDFHQKCGLLRELTKIMIFHEFVLERNLRCTVLEWRKTMTDLGKIEKSRKRGFSEK